MRHVSFTLLATISSFAAVAGAVADEWRADRLRGTVMAFADGDWHRVRRGDVVDDSRKIRTSAGAHVTFVRDRESIEIDGASEVRIFDKAGQHMTTVVQNYGSVTIDAEHRNIQHFSVQTPFLAAVVKGTRFTVSSDKVGSNVAVSRGMVQVQDTVHSLVTNVPAGLNATVAPKVALEVEGPDRKPVVATMAGIVVPLAALQAIQSAAAQGETVNAETLPAIIAKAPASSGNATTPAIALTPTAQADAIALPGVAHSSSGAQANQGNGNSNNSGHGNSGSDYGNGHNNANSNGSSGGSSSGNNGNGSTGVSSSSISSSASTASGSIGGSDDNGSGPGGSTGNVNSGDNGQGNGRGNDQSTKDAEKAAKDAEKAAKDAAKDAEKAAKDAEKDARDANKGK